MKFKSLLAVVLFVTVACAWVPVGPVRVPVLCGDESSSDPDVMYIVVARGHAQNLMRSNDRGLNWASANDSLPFQPRSVSVSPTDAATLYAVSGRVHRSTDSGATWVDLPTPSGLWFGLSADHTQPQLLLAVGCGPAGGGDRAALCRSTDQGMTWQLTWCDTMISSCGYSVTVDPSDTNTIYCGGFARGHVFCYKTTDGGSTWISRDVGVTGYGAAPDSAGLDTYPFESPGTKCPGALLVSPSSRNTVLLGTRGSGLYRSIDGGVVWNRISGASLNCTYALAVARRIPEVIYAGCEYDVLHSTNGGQNWEDWWGGAYGLQERCVFVPEDSAEVVFCGNDAGLFRGTAPGRYWTLLWLGQIGVLAAIAQSQDSAGIAYAALRDLGLFRSTDAGVTWSPSSSLPNCGNVSGLIASGSQAVWALEGPDSGCGRLYRSQNGGHSWQLESDWLEEGGGLAASHADSGFLVAVGRKTDSLSVSRFAVLHTTDAGATWDSNLLCGDGSGRAAAVSPPGAIVAGDSAGLPVAYFSPDRGSSWRRADSGLLGRVNCVGFATWPSNPLFAGTTQGVYVSSDNGVSWRYAGLAQVRAIAFDAYYHEVYAATRTGVYVSANEGASWSTTGSGLANPDALALTLADNGYEAVALVGTNGSGAFRTTFGHVGVVEPGSAATVQVGELRVTPNPTRGPARISMSLGAATEVSGALFDRGGRCITALVPQWVPVGQWQWQWNPGALPSGVYFLRLSAGVRSLAARVVFVR